MTLEQQKSWLIWIHHEMESASKLSVCYEIENVPSKWLLAHNDVQPEDGRKTSAALKRVHENLLHCIARIGVANSETIKLSQCIQEARTYESLRRIHPGAKSPPSRLVNSELGASGATMSFLDPVTDIEELKAVRAVALCIRRSSSSSSSSLSTSKSE